MTMDEYTKHYWQQHDKGHRYLEGGYFEASPDPETPNLPPALRPAYVQYSTIDKLAGIMGNDSLTKTQARRFFNHCRAVESQLRSRRTGWQNAYVEISKMDHFAASALKKGKIPRSFHAFIKSNISCVHCSRDFLEGFLPHFEALMNFGAIHFTERES